MERAFKPRALGEIAIRVRDMAAMVAFYQDVIGLDLMRNFEDRIVFFRLGPGFAGHTSVLALFDHNIEGTAARRPLPASCEGTTLHHIALSLARAEQDAVVAWYETRGQPYRVEEFPWVGWRGIFTEDPEGNTVELVAYDPAIGPHG